MSGPPSGLLPSCFPTKIPYVFLFPIHATCPAHLVLLGLITQMKYYEKYKSCTSFLCSFPQSTVTSSLRPEYLPQLSTVLSDTLSLCCSFNARQTDRQTDSKFHTHTKLQFCVQYTLSHPTLD